MASIPDEHETVINYTLKWNWLENPSNTTFGGIPQIDLCRCPRQKHRVKNVKTKDHIYTRFKCYGPEVRFKGGREELWVPSPGYAKSGQINFLRPATKEELSRRPNANILSTCRTVYEESLPVLYRGRNFLFVTGPCPRGRYQAYATHIFFARLSTKARALIMAFSLIAIPHEEDCNNEDVARAYADLAAWNWIVDRGDGWIEEIEDIDGLRSALREEGPQRKHAHVGPLWEEVQAGTLSKAGKGATTLVNPDNLLEKWRGKGKARFEESSEQEEGDWNDAVLILSSSTKGKTDSEGWEMV
ncbi:hypothetical protein N0V90_010248 [Kalmusia sp. IMI 367209]|nr:hypothetical protein N0V90_010248 [Kalmusia sp. IMI 367209]